MAQFMISFNGFSTTTSAKTAMKVIGASAKAVEVFEMAMYGDGRSAPQDIQHEGQLGFLSNAGAGTPGASPTPYRKAQGSAVSGLTAGTGYSAEPTTYSSPQTLIAFNQRGGIRWSVPPGQGFSTDGNQTNLSIGALVISGSAGTVAGEMIWAE